MPLHFLPLALTVLAVVLLGIIAIIGSTSGGADWLQKLWQRDGAAPDADGAHDGPAPERDDRAGPGPHRFED